MLFAIGRFATGRLASTAFATSAARSVVFRATAKSQLQATSIYGHYARPVRRFASARVVKKTPASKSAKTSAKKPAKKTPTKKPVKKSTKTTAKAKPKAKGRVKAKATAKPKAKPGPRPKKTVLTPEQKAFRERKELREIAQFNKPKQLPEHPWILYLSGHFHGEQSGGEHLATKSSSLAREFKQIPPAEIERMKSKCLENKALNAAAYKAWTESYTVPQILEANKARRRLKRVYDYPKGPLKLIRDARIPKKPPTAYGLFTREQWASPDAKGGNIRELSLKISSAWKALGAAERQPYETLARQQAAEHKAALSSA